jgi:hypothetical protein
MCLEICEIATFRVKRMIQTRRAALLVTVFLVQKICVRSIWLIAALENEIFRPPESAGAFLIMNLEDCRRCKIHSGNHRSQFSAWVAKLKPRCKKAISANSRPADQVNSITLLLPAKINCGVNYSPSCCKMRQIPLRLNWETKIPK